MSEVTRAQDNGLTFGGDPGLKARLVARMREHYDQDTLTAGTYAEVDEFQETSGTNFRGCAMGCSLVDSNGIRSNRELRSELNAMFDSLDVDRDNWDLATARMWGLPLWVARMEETVFEGLEPSEARTRWPLDLAEALPVGEPLEVLQERLREAVYVALLENNMVHFEGNEELADRFSRGAIEAAVSLDHDDSHVVRRAILMELGLPEEAVDGEPVPA